MDKQRFRLLERNARGGKKTSLKRRKELFTQINKLLDKKAFGVFLLSEIDNKGEDLVHYMAISCDKKHSKQLIDLLFENLPGLKEEYVELATALVKDVNISKNMVV